MTFFSVFPQHPRESRRRCATPHGCRHARCSSDPGGQERSGALTLGAYLHVVMPAVVVVAALVLQALHNALPMVTLVALVSAAYGRLLWLEFLERERGLARSPDRETTDGGVAQQGASSEVPTR